jgi:hypothetical protein
MIDIILRDALDTGIRPDNLAFFFISGIRWLWISGRPNIRQKQHRYPVQP